MSPSQTETLIAVISLITFLFSVSTSVYLAGRNRGKSEERLNNVELNVEKLVELSTDVRLLTRDVAEIKGMFTLRLKDGSNADS